MKHGFCKPLGMKKEEQHLDKDSLKNSYFTILAIFAADPSTTSAQLDGIRAWGKQLEIKSEALHDVINHPDTFLRQQPDTPQSSIEQLYNLVYMIYLDKVVDDYEIEILMKYAARLGFPQHIIGDLMKAILTAPSDGVPAWQVKNELRVLLEESLN